MWHKDHHTKHNDDISKTFRRTLEFSFSLKNLYHNENIFMTFLLCYTVMPNSFKMIIPFYTKQWYFKDILIAQFTIKEKMIYHTVVSINVCNIFMIVLKADESHILFQMVKHWVILLNRAIGHFSMIPR